MKMARIINTNYKDKTINLFCRGSSGAIIAGIISTKVKNCNIVHIKKEGEESHGESRYSSAGYNIIVDDFIATGTTVFKIIEDSKNLYNVKQFDAIIVSSNVKKYIVRKLREQNVIKLYCKFTY